MLPALPENIKLPLGFASLDELTVMEARLEDPAVENTLVCVFFFHFENQDIQSQHQTFCPTIL
jgi:hypothetical protein